MQFIRSAPNITTQLENNSRVKDTPSEEKAVATSY